MIPGYCDCGKPAGRTGKCASCETQARKAARTDTKGHKKRHKIARTSKNKAAKLRQYTPLRAEYLMAHPLCEIRLDGCTNRATDIHHCSTSDLDFLNVSTWKGSCRHCHTVVETVLSAAERREKGLLI